MNGNVGSGVAVAGAFSLVRFRSVPGSAKEICTLFLAMGAGLITGMGYLGFAVLFTLVMCAMFMLYNHIDFGAKKNSDSYKIFSITIPEDLNYDDVPSLRTEARQKLTAVRPLSIGQASRISGVSPADISVLLVWLEHKK